MYNTSAESLSVLAILYLVNKVHRYMNTWTEAVLILMFIVVAGQGQLNHMQQIGLSGEHVGVYPNGKQH